MISHLIILMGFYISIANDAPFLLAKLENQIVNEVRRGETGCMSKFLPVKTEQQSVTRARHIYSMFIQEKRYSHL